MTPEMANFMASLQQQSQQQFIEAMERFARDRGAKPWDHPDRFQNLKVFGGEQKYFEEWSTKLRALVAAADIRTHRLLTLVESDCTEEELVKGKYHGVIPEFGPEDSDFITQSSAKFHNLLLQLTTGDAYTVVRRSEG